MLKKGFYVMLVGMFILISSSLTTYAESSTELQFIKNNDLLVSMNEFMMKESDEKYIYTFELDAMKKVDLTLDSGDKTVIIYIKDANGDDLLFMNNDVTTGKITDEIGLPKGKYSIEISRRYSHHGDIPFKLNLTLSDSPYYEVESNGTFETANNVLLNTTYKANSHMMRNFTSVNSDEDYFRFEVPQNGKYGFKVDAKNTPRLYLYGQSKNYLDEIRDYNNEFELLEGVYYLKVYNGSAYYENQPYSFEINYLKFDDVALSHWAVKEIGFLSDYNIIRGYGDGKFLPDQEITRYEAATMIVRALDLNMKNRPDPSFTDVAKKHWAYDAVATVVDEGIFSDAKLFNGSQTLTREQAAKILVESYDLSGTTQKSFKDVSQNRWSSDYISTLLANNITDGFLDGTFRPSNPVTKAQFTTFLTRLIDDKYKPVN